MLALGEVHTGMLRHSVAASAALSDDLLSLVGQRAEIRERPNSFAVSPSVYTGIDCWLPTSRSGVRGVGTVASRVAITSGRIVQGSAFVAVVSPTEDSHGRRRPWSYYLSRLGTVETLTGVNAMDVSGAHAAAHLPQRSINLGAIGERFLDSVQMSSRLDHRPPFPAPRTRLRWAVHGLDTKGDRTARFTVERGGLRTLRLGFGGIEDVAAIAALCEDIAAHDWLLTMLLAIVDRSQIGGDHPARVLERLRPAIQHLLHLWMPAARAHGGLAEFWEMLERRPGFTRQWESLVRRIRDHVAMCSVRSGPVTLETGTTDLDRSMAT